MRDLLTTIRARRVATFEPSDWEHIQLSTGIKTIRVGTPAVVEGLFSARPEVGALVEVPVLVESPPLIRAGRQRQRADASEDWL